MSNVRKPAADRTGIKHDIPQGTRFLRGVVSGLKMRIRLNRSTRESVSDGGSGSSLFLDPQ